MPCAVSTSFSNSEHIDTLINFQYLNECATKTKIIYDVIKKWIAVKIIPFYYTFDLDSKGFYLTSRPIYYHDSGELAIEKLNNYHTENFRIFFCHLSNPWIDFERSFSFYESEKTKYPDNLDLSKHKSIGRAFQRQGASLIPAQSDSAVFRQEFDSLRGAIVRAVDLCHVCHVEVCLLSSLLLAARCSGEALLLLTLKLRLCGNLSISLTSLKLKTDIQIKNTSLQVHCRL
ncbi:hypothetical protein RF11_11704 [Thelohanellus kitauei]|uniref:Uncharacterized protein n=1 Tax=Thelohanellus kitauei TaxID=669202 RepID=A0A0C2NFI3_THEKT|nr:hypothetical protein RF11_11704 [Thelohanellus kitauei]